VSINTRVGRLEELANAGCSICRGQASSVECVWLNPGDWPPEDAPTERCTGGRVVRRRRLFVRWQDESPTTAAAVH
jgi:hypothetical protein